MSLHLWVCNHSLVLVIFLCCCSGVVYRHSEYLIMPDNWYYAFNELTDMLVVYGVSLYNNSSPAVCLC